MDFEKSGLEVELMRMMRDGSIKENDFRRIAKASKIDLDESFLISEELRGPLFQPYLEQTISDFNDRYLFNGKEYKQEQIDLWGRKLAKVMSSWSSSGSSMSEYDEDGNQIESDYESGGVRETEYVYQDGLVVKSRTRHQDSYGSETEYKQVGSEEDEDFELSTSEIAEISEATNKAGRVIKSIRSKKKMSRNAMATKMRITASRLKEIEDGDDYEDDEIKTIASALGMSTQKLKRTIDSFTGESEENNGKIAIVRKVVSITKPEIKTFTQEEIIDFEVREGKWESTHRLDGFIMEETVKKNPDGSINFSVPLFKLDEYTSNANRYTKVLAENLVKHFKRIDKKTSKISYEKTKTMTANDIAVAEMLDGHSLDMLATHRARQGKGNPLLERAGRILGGKIGKVEGDETFIIMCKTIGGPAGQSITAQMEEHMIGGVSLYLWPTKFEENERDGHDVNDGMLVGADFTNEGGNLIQFRNKSSAAPTLS